MALVLAAPWCLPAVKTIFLRGMSCFHFYEQSWQRLWPWKPSCNSSLGTSATLGCLLSRDLQEREMRKNHRLFQQFPLNGSAAISTGTLPTPYHIYDGYGVLIGGTVDLAAAQRLLSQESIVPLQTHEGRSLMAIWLCNFTDASLGPHHELQSFFFTSSRRPEPVGSHPLALLALMTDPEVQMLCHGLWNNTRTAVAYNRELLSLNARLSQSHVQNRGGTLTFNVEEEANGTAVLAGRIANPQRMSWRANWDLIRQLGFGKTWAYARQPWVGLQILNPTGVGLTRNAVAQSFTKNDVNSVHYFDQPGNVLSFGDTAYSGLNFEPQFVQYMKGFKFVYLQPK